MYADADKGSGTANQLGFTLVELLVTMLVLGLLAAVAIPEFFSQVHRASDAEAKVAARTAETAIEAYATDHDGHYTGADSAALRAIEPTLNGANVAVDLAEADRYQLSATSSTGNAFHVIRNPNGTFDLTCEPPGDAGCPAGGEWG